MSIRVTNLTKKFNGFTAVDGVSLGVDSGELVAFLGPSGSGKSTILRIIAGLEAADAGEVWLEGERTDHLHARARGVGFVFQHYALFRHMTVAENIGFGLAVQGAARPRRRRRVQELLELMGLQGFGGRYPAQLSGGQRQRVALARALAPEPKVLLLDEPFGAVDAKVREELRHWLRRLHDEVQVTSIFVTHDQEEAFSVADRVMVINRGRLEQAGSPAEILDNPGTEFVARFIGRLAGQHAHGHGADLSRPPIVPVFVFPLSRSQRTLHVAERAFFQVLPGDLGQLIEEHDAMPFGRFLFLARRLVHPPLGCCDVGVGDRLAVRGVARFRICAQPAHEDDLVHAAHLTSRYSLGSRCTPGTASDVTADLSPVLIAL